MLIDTITYNIMQSIENPATTIATKIISFVFDPITFTTLAVAVAIYLFFKSQKKQSIFFASTILITAIIIKLSKQILQVARPTNSIIQETGFSFPSGHVTMAIVFLGLIAYMFTKKKQNDAITTVIIALIILAVGFSRIYLRVHWLTDTLAGLIIGSIILILSIKAHDKLITSP